MYTILDLNVFQGFISIKSLMLIHFMRNKIHSARAKDLHSLIDKGFEVFVQEKYDKMLAET